MKHGADLAWRSARWLARLFVLDFVAFVPLSMVFARDASNGAVGGAHAIGVVALVLSAVVAHQAAPRVRRPAGVRGPETRAALLTVATIALVVAAGLATSAFDPLVRLPAP